MNLPWEGSKKAINIGIIGDLILDEYLDGHVNRISPEAPVPVLHVHRTRHSPGGAANSALNIAKVGGCAVLFGVWGDDATSATLEKLLKEAQISTQRVLKDPSRNTIKKTRVSADNQQLLRLDWERISTISKHQQERLLNNIKKENVDAFLVSDYGKGTLPQQLLEELFNVCQQRGIPCIVDPKGTDFSKYKGATVITPNYREACKACGVDPESSPCQIWLAETLQRRFDLQDVLITLGSQGMMYLPKGGQAINKQATAREVYDVSGAGDTVASIFSLALASKVSIDQSLHLANIAAGTVVEKWGTQAVTATELKSQLLDCDIEDTNKHLSLATLELTIKKWRNTGKKIVFTNGCFDLLHYGHIEYLNKAKAFGDILLVGVNSDDSIRELKGEERPIFPLAQRLKMLASLTCVDGVIPFFTLTPKTLIETISPDILVKGEDYQESEIAGAASVLEHGGEVRRIPLVPDVSTTKILGRLRKEKTL